MKIKYIDETKFSDKARTVKTMKIILGVGLNKLKIAYALSVVLNLIALN